MAQQNLGLEALTRQFEIHNRSEGKSVRTVEWYNQALTLFLQWLQSEGIPSTLDRLGEDQVRAFILHLQGRSGVRGAQSSHTVNNRVRALRAFFAWLHRRGYTEENRLKDLRLPKTTEKVIEVLTTDEVGRIFAAIDPDSFLGARNTAIFSLMLDTGLRLSETTTLKHEDVHLQDRYVKVLGKGGKERMVGFGVACQRALVHYAYHYRMEPGHGVDTFFINIDGHPLAPDALRSLTGRVSRAADVPRLHPHLLRHTYATNYLVNGGDVFSLKQNLGHTTLVMVEHYVHLASQRVALISRDFSPLDRWEVPRARRNRHVFKGGAQPGRIYPNKGRATRGKGARSAPTALAN